MNQKQFSKEATGIAVAILFLALGFLVIWISNSMKLTIGDAVFVSLLLIPILIYVIFTKQLRELKGPGGLEIKLEDTADTPAKDVASENIAGMDEEISVITKGGVENLEEWVSQLDVSKPILLKAVLGSENQYRPDVLKIYIERLIGYRTFQFMVIVDKMDRLFAFIPPLVVLQILKRNQADQLIQLVTSGNSAELSGEFPSLITRKISVDDNILDALKAMTDEHLDAIPLVDKHGKVIGLVEREQILSKLMLAMAK